MSSSYWDMTLATLVVVGFLSCSGDGSDPVSEVSVDDLAANAVVDPGEDSTGDSVEDLVADAPVNAPVDTAEDIPAAPPEDVSMETDGGDSKDAPAHSEDDLADSEVAIPETCIPTASDAQGPYYLGGAPFVDAIAGPNEPGERLLIHGRVVDEDCAGIPEAVVDVWQTDADGNYPGAEEGWRLRGRIQADGGGAYAFVTVLPGFYEGRPRHIHVKVSGPGAILVTTQLYFEGDPYLWPEDSCGPPTCHSNDPDRILALTETAPSTDANLAAKMEFVLSGESDR